MTTPATIADDMAYTRCEQCAGTLTMARPPGPCWCTRSSTPGWVPTGVTLGQLERYADRERALAGDPGLPADRRLAILLKLRSRVTAAIGRLTADCGGEG